MSHGRASETMLLRKGRCGVNTSAASARPCHKVWAKGAISCVSQNDYGPISVPDLSGFGPWFGTKTQVDLLNWYWDAREMRLMKLVLMLMIGGRIGSVFASDHALVIGVGQYPSLKRSELKGPRQDAEEFAAFLKSKGFEVTLLLDSLATRGGILSKLEELSKNEEPLGKFVFYFAGHGTRSSSGDSALLPYDAEDSSPGQDIRSKDLAAAVRAIPASSRTLVLDSCFSGGMLYSSKSIGRTWTSRYYVRNPVGSKGLDVQPVESSAAVDPVLSVSSDLCYVAASRHNEQAHEDVIEGRTRGIFTYYLLSSLKAEPKSWGSVQSTVSSQVARHTDDLQHPSLSRGYSSTPMFQPRQEETAAPALGETLLDQYTIDHFDPERLRLTMDPNVTTLRVGDRLRFYARVGASGYLVLLERGTSGKIQLLRPLAGEGVEDCRVDEGDIVRIPPAGRSFAPDAVGHERIKGILFSNREQAAALIEAFPRAASKGFDVIEAAQVPVKASESGPSEFYTADFLFEVIPKEESSRSGAGHAAVAGLPLLIAATLRKRGRKRKATPRDL